MRHHPADALLPAGGAASEPARFDAFLSLITQRGRWGVLACFVSGTVNAASYGMSGVYGERAGPVTWTEIAFFIAAMLIGPDHPPIPVVGAVGRPDGAALDAAADRNRLGARLPRHRRLPRRAFWGLALLSLIVGGLSHPVYALGLAYVERPNSIRVISSAPAARS